MAPPKSNFLDKVLGRIDRLDSEGLQSVIQRLARERSFLETLFNTIEDGVLVADEGGRILYYNQAASTLLGLQPGAEGQSGERYLPGIDWKKLTRRAGEPGRVSRHEFEIDWPRPRFLHLYATPIEAGVNGINGVVIILHDATDARQKTFEAIESERIQALTLLAASVAHEIGNPLNALHIHLQLLERELKKLRRHADGSAQTAIFTRRRQPRKTDVEGVEIVDKMQGFLGVAKGEIARLDYIITQFLQAIRPSPPKLQPQSLNELIADTLALLQPELDNRHLHVHRRLAPKLTPTPMDPAQIKQVLVNLIKNAMQSMTRGGELTLQTGAGADGVWFSVADTGDGIPAEQINRIFEPFFTTRATGSGLGLMIVQRIVREHGGRIELESRVGEGTQFRIWLPLHERKPRLLEARVT